MKSAQALTVLVGCVSLLAWGARLSPDYAIVIPQKDGTVRSHYEQMGARLLQEGIEKACGFHVAMVEEGSFKGHKGIFVGETQRAIKAGLSLENLEYSTCRVKADAEGNLYFRGRFSENPSYLAYRDQRTKEIGTLRGICEFLRLYAGLRVPLPTPKARFFKRGPIVYPDELDVVYRPHFTYVEGRTAPDAVYDTANGFLYPAWYKCYGGHSHGPAIPQSLYESHPEYFALTKSGKRWKGLQFCLSNPAVQELIYREMLRWLDKGFAWVQLGQSDGFSPCQCESCRKLFGVENWSEKMWLLHRSMAERLRKDRPGKKVVILCYPPNSAPPQSFRNFPDNVIIELCRYSEADLKAWKGYGVPGGFVAYVYNWGAFSPAGLTPHFTPQKAVEQVRLLHRYGIQGIFRCGFGDMYGLSGPEYYAYGCALNDPEKADGDQALREFCQLLFGKAAKTMVAFYQGLYERQRIELDKKHEDYANIHAGPMPGGYANHRLIAGRFTVEAVRQFEKQLQEARQLEPKNPYLPLIDTEFAFLARTAAMCRNFLQYLSAPDERSFKAMKAAVEERTNFLNGLPAVRGHLRWINGIPVYGQHKLSYLHEGGSWKARFVYPLTWPLDWLEEEKIYPGGRALTTGGEAQKLLANDLNQPPETWGTIRTQAYKDGVGFILEVPGVTAKEMFYVVIDQTRYVFRKTYSRADVYTATSPTRQVKDAPKELTRIRSKGDRILCFLPYRLLTKTGDRPKKGESVSFNIYCQRGRDRKVFVYEPDIHKLQGWRSWDSGRGRLIISLGDSDGLKAFGE